jgi:hypothetical protein
MERYLYLKKQIVIWQRCHLYRKTNSFKSSPRRNELSFSSPKVILTLGGHGNKQPCRIVELAPLPNIHLVLFLVYIKPYIIS